jgi:hypothetical protein
VLAVTRLGVDRWQPYLRDGGRGPACRTRLAAQRWCERKSVREERWSKQRRGRQPVEEITITVHMIEFDGSAPAPWKITADDSTEWHAPSERDAAAQLLEWVNQRENTMRRLPERGGAAVSRGKVFPFLRIEVVDGEVHHLVKKKKRPGQHLGCLAGARTTMVQRNCLENLEGVVSSAIRLAHGGRPVLTEVRGPTIAHISFANLTGGEWRVSGVGGRAAAEVEDFNRLAGEAREAEQLRPRSPSRKLGRSRRWGSR